MFDKSRAETGQVESWLPSLLEASPLYQKIMIVFQNNIQRSHRLDFIIISYNRKSRTGMSINMTLSAIEVCFVHNNWTECHEDIASLNMVVAVLWFLGIKIRLECPCLLGDWLLFLNPFFFLKNSFDFLDENFIK